MSERNVEKLIVDSATSFFSKFGFAKTTMDEIAKHIHKAKGVLYYYFKSKEELFNEVLKQELSTVKSKLSQVVEKEDDSLIILKEYILIRLKLLHRALNYHETLKADFFEKYHFVNDVRTDFDDFNRSNLTIILTKGKQEGYFNFKDLNSTVDVIMMIVSSIEIPLFIQNLYPVYEDTIEELSSMVVNSLKTSQ
ncbi:helix-turn-helix domain-containing protein [uncultured Acetobacteroides sp.]|uniref:TetR/AcrR family transcriptional regulator n=1 Tax=uncultured Acetobacteroides sp. TaxID=1760811 RepID=UPI0029F495A7|nr:helix-turn-helix domain-containing protein [uncultured Acetobacteroides sp.]